MVKLSLSESLEVSFPDRNLLETEGTTQLKIQRRGVFSGGMQLFLQQSMRHDSVRNQQKMDTQSVSELSTKLEEEFACLANSASAYFWYIDNGASAHITGVREHFSSYQEEQIDFQVTMGNITKCTPVGRGTIAFQTEARTNIQDTNALHVLVLGMNLISVSQL